MVFSAPTRRWCCLLLLGVGLPWAAAAQSASATLVPPNGTEPVVVGVIDMQRLLTETTGAQVLTSQRGAYLSRYQAQAAALEKSLAVEDQALAAQQGKLSREDFNARQENFRKKLGDYQVQGQTRRLNLERAFRLAMNSLNNAILKAASSVAGERKMTYVLHRTQVFLFDQRMDITDAVLARVNKEFPNATMPDPDSLPPELEPQGQVDQFPVPRTTTNP